jgi:hypothetical protein
MATHKDSKQWFENSWILLCEHMYLDPYVKPKFLDNLDYYAFMKKEWEANNKDADAIHDYKQDDEFRQKLAAAPWTAEEYPQVARWVKERSPVLDLVGVAVRKPNFVCWRWRTENPIAILLPDVQAQRQFARELQVRITERLGKGDIEEAWYDVMSMFYLSRKHYIDDPILVINLVGIAIEGMGWESAKVVLQHGKATPEQLERFAQDLDSIPRKLVLDLTFEKKLFYSHLASSKEKWFISMFTDLSSSGGGGQVRQSYAHYFYLCYLPFDRNIAGKRITESIDWERHASGDATWNINWTVMKNNAEIHDKFMDEKAKQLSFPWALLRMPLIRTRSQLIADSLIYEMTPTLQGVQHALNRVNTQFELLRLAVAVERYKAASGNYPAALDELVPKYLEEVPLDPYPLSTDCGCLDCLVRAHLRSG